MSRCSKPLPSIPSEEDPEALYQKPPPLVPPQLSHRKPLAAHRNADKSRQEILSLRKENYGLRKQVDILRDALVEATNSIEALQKSNQSYARWEKKNNEGLSGLFEAIRAALWRHADITKPKLRVDRYQRIQGPYSAFSDSDG